MSIIKEKEKKKIIVVNDKNKVIINKSKPKRCPHGKQKSMCKECDGVGVCIHGRRKQICRPCGGSGFCVHDKLKYRCKDCKGGSICEHGQRKTDCRYCDGSSICEHKKYKYRCIECKGSGICEHGHYKVRCVECDSKCICIHKKRMYNCPDCGGEGTCIHKINKNACRKCKTARLCPHDKFKSNCCICDIKKNPHRWCELCKHTAVWESQYKPYCLPCYCILNPDVKVKRQYKLKEHHLRDELIKLYPEIKMIFDKKIDNGCSVRRPDVRIECFTHTIIIECDENKHSGYSCDNKRTMEIFQDLGNRPIVFLRFNPDSYKNIKTGKNVEGCFKQTTNVKNSIQIKEWTRRIEYLKNKIDYYLKNIPIKEVTIEELFYE